MTSQPDGSVTRWLGELKTGEDVDAAAQALWERSFHQLVRLARARLRAARAARPTRRMWR
jgi:hypothetical protein